MKKRIIFTIMLLSVIGIVYYFRLYEYIRLETIQKYRVLIQQYINQYYILSSIVYILLYAFVTSFAFPGTFALTMAGGYFFGVFPGIVFVNIAATLGATGAFLTSRYLVGQFVHKAYPYLLHRINWELDTWGVFYLLGIRLIAVIPFFVINLVLGLTGISVFTFVWTTSLGIIPGSFIYIKAGEELAHVEKVQDLFSPEMIILMICGILLLILPLFFRYTKPKKS